MSRQSQQAYHALGRQTGGWFTILKDTYVSFQEDECTVRAAAIAYRALFSIFPLVLLVFALSSSLLARPQVRSQLVDFTLQNLQAPGLASEVIAQANHILDESEAVSILALIGLLWGGSGVFGTIDNALNTAWNVRRRRSFWRSKAVSLLAALVVIILFLLSVVATAIVNAIQFLPEMATFIPLSEYLGQAIGFLLPIALSFTMFLPLYKLLPYTQVTWRSVTLGALLAAVLWQVSNILYSIYVARVAAGRYSLVYGPFVAVILFLLWIYVSSIILLIGAELAAAYDKNRGAPHAVRRPLPE